MTEDDIDFAVVARRDGDRWQVAEVAATLGEDLDRFLPVLDRFGDDSDVLGMVSVADEFFVIVRSSGDDVRVLLSDATMADLWPLATAVAEMLGLPEVTDEDLFPDDALLEVAERLGFGAALEAIVG